MKRGLSVEFYLIRFMLCPEMNLPRVTIGYGTVGYFICGRIAVWAIFEIDLYRRLLLSPVLSSEPLLAILER